jgi:voltage-gated potassium channel
MNSLLNSPARNVISVTLFMLVVVVATAGDELGGWSFQDAVYITPFLHALTMGTMIVGCTGMIFFTGALVQFFTIGQLQQLLGLRRMQTEIDKLSYHVIICGFGRIGVALAQALQDGGRRSSSSNRTSGGWPRRGAPAIFACRATPPTRAY